MRSARLSESAPPCPRSSRPANPRRQTTHPRQTGRTVSIASATFSGVSPPASTMRCARAIAGRPSPVDRHAGAAAPHRIRRIHQERRVGRPRRRHRFGTLHRERPQHGPTERRRIVWRLVAVQLNGADAGPRRRSPGSRPPTRSRTRRPSCHVPRQRRDDLGRALRRDVPRALRPEHEPEGVAPHATACSASVSRVMPQIFTNILHGSRTCSRTFVSGLWASKDLVRNLVRSCSTSIARPSRSSVPSIARAPDRGRS